MLMVLFTVTKYPEVPIGGIESEVTLFFFMNKNGDNGGFAFSCWQARARALCCEDMIKIPDV